MRKIIRMSQAKNVKWYQDNEEEVRSVFQPPKFYELPQIYNKELIQDILYRPYSCDIRRVFLVVRRNVGTLNFKAEMSKHEEAQLVRYFDAFADELAKENLGVKLKEEDAAFSL